MPSGIKSIEVGGRLLSVLTSARRPLPLSDLAKAASMSPSKAHRYLSSFVQVGLVEQHRATRDYRLGAFAFEMGLVAIGSSDHLGHAMQMQVKLRAELDETVVLSVWGTHGPTVLRIEESSHPVIMTMRVGVTLPLMHSAAGRIFAAFMPRRIIEAHLDVMNRASENSGRRGSVRYADIETELGEIRRAGFAISKGEVLRGVSATAVPLLTAHGQLVGALAVIGQQDSLKMSADGRITRALKLVSAGYRSNNMEVKGKSSAGSESQVRKNPKSRPFVTDEGSGKTNQCEVRDAPYRRLAAKGNVEC